MEAGPYTCHKVHSEVMNVLLKYLKLLVTVCNRSFREYGEKVLNELEIKLKADPKLQKASVNYEGVCVDLEITSKFE